MADAGFYGGYRGADFILAPSREEAQIGQYYVSYYKEVNNTWVKIEGVPISINRKSYDTSKEETDEIIFALPSGAGVSGLIMENDNIYFVLTDGTKLNAGNLIIGIDSSKTATVASDGKVTFPLIGGDGDKSITTSASLRGPQGYTISSIKQTTDDPFKLVFTLNDDNETELYAYIPSIINVKIDSDDGIHIEEI